MVLILINTIVFILNKTIIVILIISMSLKKNNVNRIIYTGISIYNLAFSVIPLFSLKFFMCLLYTLVLSNHLLIFSELFKKQKELKIRKGVVGNIGITIPIHPTNNEVNPKLINNAFLNNLYPLVYLLPSFSDVHLTIA